MNTVAPPKNDMSAARAKKAENDRIRRALAEERLRQEQFKQAVSAIPAVTFIPEESISEEEEEPIPPPSRKRKARQLSVEPYNDPPAEQPKVKKPRQEPQHEQAPPALSADSSPSLSSLVVPALGVLLTGVSLFFTVAAQMPVKVPTTPDSSMALPTQTLPRSHHPDHYSLL